MSDQRSEAIVIAEADLIGGHRVVLVDDRHHAHLEEPVQGALSIAVVGAARHVICCEKDLADRDVTCCEGQGVLGKQHPLADTCRGLLRREVTRTTTQPQDGKPGRDRPTGDEDHLAAGGNPVSDDIDELRDAFDVDAAARFRERRGTHLDDDAARISHSRTRRAGTHQSSRRRSVPRGPVPAEPPAVIVGSQSNTTAPSPGPMTTVLPGAAPCARSCSSTPRRASRSAR